MCDESCTKSLHAFKLLTTNQYEWFFRHRRRIREKETKIIWTIIICNLTVNFMDKYLYVIR